MSASRILIGQISRRPWALNGMMRELVERDAEEGALLGHHADHPVGEAADDHLSCRSDRRP